MSSGHQPRALLRGFVVNIKYVRFLVFAYRTGRFWLFERITRGQRIRPESWKARCVTYILFTRVCVCLSSDHLRGRVLESQSITVCFIVTPYRLSPIAHTSHTISHQWRSLGAYSSSDPAGCAHRAMVRQACLLQAATEPSRSEC